MRVTFILKGLIKATLFFLVVGSLALFLLDPQDDQEVRFKCATTTKGKDSPSTWDWDWDRKVYEWDSPSKLKEYHSRFWDLLKTNRNVKVKVNISPKTSPMFRRGRVDYLWRPKGGQRGLKGEGNARVLSQMVWQMEAESFFKEELGRTEVKAKRILLPVGFSFWLDEYNLTLTPADCGPPLHSFAKCVYTENMSDLEHVDAIVSHHGPHLSSLPPSPHLLKFFSGLESPYNSQASLTRNNDILTTYWRGADVVTPYGKWVPYDPNTKAPTQVTKDYSQGKSKPAVAFISNCNTPNNRMGFIKALQKYISVDIFGNCGNKTCSRYDKNKDQCFGDIVKHYYFYLSFENSNCRDYVTEKFFGKGLKEIPTNGRNDLIPIVMGAHPEDYKVLAPQNSYIHVEDFPSIKDLAERMAFLINNPSEYNKYFEWKGTGEFIPFNQMCQICAMVHYADIVPPPKRRRRLDWNDKHPTAKGMCLPRGQWYWTRCFQSLES